MHCVLPFRVYPLWCLCDHLRSAHDRTHDLAHDRALDGLGRCGYILKQNWLEDDFEEDADPREAVLKILDLLSANDANFRELRMRFSKLIVEAKESHKWSLTEDFILYNRSVQPRWFELGLKGDLEVDEPFILVESGFITAFGTTPRLFWWFLSDSVLVEEPRGRQMSFFLLVFGAPTST